MTGQHCNSYIYEDIEFNTHHISVSDIERAVNMLNLSCAQLPVMFKF